MSNWEQISLRDAVGKVVFDDEWGFMRFDGNISYEIDGEGLGYYYIDVDGQKTQYSEERTAANLMKLFSQELFRSNHSYGYYGKHQQYFSVEVKEITVQLSVTKFHYDGGNYRDSDSFAINKKNKKRLEYLRKVWICDDIQNRDFNPRKYYKAPFFKDLKVGDEILFNGKKHKIGAVYDQPNVSGYMFKATPSYEGAAGDAVDIGFSDKIYVLPYGEQPYFETERFNTYTNEFALSPYAIRDGQCLNVYWNKIDDAAAYTVSLYIKYVGRPYLQTVYHLKDYAVDRNDGFVSIGGLVGGVYIVTVRAENRSGETVAQSRGIVVDGKDRCLPIYWKEN